MPGQVLGLLDGIRQYSADRHRVAVSEEAEGEKAGANGCRSGSGLPATGCPDESPKLDGE